MNELMAHHVPASLFLTGPGEQGSQVCVEDLFGQPPVRVFTVTAAEWVYRGT